MKNVTLRGTTLNVSAVCLGTGDFGSGLPKEDAFAILDAFTATGGNFVDTANVYGKWNPDKRNISEITLGEWMKSRKAFDKLVIATKGGHYNLSSPDISRVTRQAVREDIEESLRALGLDRIDFYWLHRDDETIPIEDIIGMMEYFVSEGLIRWYGASNYKQERMDAAVRYTKKNGCQGFTAVSNRWSLAVPSPGESPGADPSLAAMDDAFYQWHCETGMPAIPYSASARGFFEKLYALNPIIQNGKLLTPLKELALPDRLKRLYLNETNLRTYERLLALKDECNCSLYALSLAYFAGHPFQAIPVSSVRNTRQLEELIRAGEILVPHEAMM